MATEEEKKIKEEEKAKKEAEKTEADRIKAEEKAKKDADKLAEEAKKKDVVEVKREDWDKLMAHMEKQSRDIELLYKTADKSRMAKELNKEGENLIKQANVRLWSDTGLLVIGWSDMKTNRCEVSMGKWYEEQTVTFTLEDGTTKTVPYLEFVRSTILKAPADIISRTEEIDEKNNKVTLFRLQFENGKKLDINSVFVN